MSSETIVVACLALGLSIGCGTEGGTELPETSGSAPGAGAQTPTVAAVRATLARVDEGIRVIGSSRPVRAANLGPQMTARITEIQVEEGSSVSEGDVLVRLDARASAISARQARAMAEAATVQAEQTSAEVDRLRPLASEGTIASQQMDQLLAQQRATAASANAANAAVAQAQTMLRNSSIRAPFDGIVSSVRMEVGETATLMPPSVVLRVVDLSELEVRGRVSERHLPSLELGAPVTARFIALDRSVEGRVSFVGLEVDPQTRTVEVIARIPNEEGALRAGTSVEITIAAGEPREAVTLPQAAVGGAGDARRAFVLVDGRAMARDVTVRPIAGNRVEVVAGIDEGELVITPFTTALADGASVEIADPVGARANAGADPEEADEERVQ